MNNEVIPYDFNNHEVRTFLDNNQDPWFVAKDVLEVLGVQRNSLLKIKDKWKGVKIVNTPGGKQKTAIINEPAVYSLIMKSRRKEAVAFQDWVFEDVLPSLRKTGEYRIQRESIKPGYREMSSNIFALVGSAGEKSTKHVANLINKAVIGMKASECEQKYGLRPRDYVLKNCPDKLAEYDSLQHMINHHLEHGGTPLEVRSVLKKLRYNV